MLRRTIFGGVNNVHTWGFGSARSGVGSGQNPHVSAGSQCLQGPECGSSPTSGTTYSLVRGDFALTCVQGCGDVPLTQVRGLRPGRRGGLRRCVGSGFSALTGGHSACCGGIPRFLSLVLSVWSWLSNTYPWSGVGGCNMTWPALVGSFREEVLGVVSGTVSARFVLPKGVWTLSTLTSALCESRCGEERGMEFRIASGMGRRDCGGERSSDHEDQSDNQRTRSGPGRGQC